MLKGKVVLITGASEGIGASCAKLFAQRGASLALNGLPTATFQDEDSAARPGCRRRHYPDSIRHQIVDTGVDQAMLGFEYMETNAFVSLDSLIPPIAGGRVRRDF